MSSLLHFHNYFLFYASLSPSFRLTFLPACLLFVFLWPSEKLGQRGGTLDSFQTESHVDRIWFTLSKSYMKKINVLIAEEYEYSEMNDSCSVWITGGRDYGGREGSLLIYPVTSCCWHFSCELLNTEVDSSNSLPVLWTNMKWVWEFTPDAVTERGRGICSEVCS